MFLLISLFLFIIAVYSASLSPYNVTDNNSSYAANRIRTLIDKNDHHLLKKCTQRHNPKLRMQNLTASYGQYNPIVNDNELINMLQRDITCEHMKGPHLRMKNCSEMLENFMISYKIKIIEDLQHYRNYINNCGTQRYNSCNSYGDYRIAANDISIDRLYTEYVCGCGNDGNGRFCIVTNDLDNLALQLVLEIGSFSTEKFSDYNNQLVKDIDCDLIEFINELFKFYYNCKNNKNETSRAESVAIFRLIWLIKIPIIKFRDI